LLAHSQMPRPAVQCLIASSIVSHCLMAEPVMAAPVASRQPLR
jgi:hypothetical protein